MAAAGFEHITTNDDCMQPTGGGSLAANQHGRPKPAHFTSSAPFENGTVKKEEEEEGVSWPDSWPKGPYAPPDGCVCGMVLGCC